MDKLDLKSAYEGLLAHSKNIFDRDGAMRYAIGGEFDAFGVIERELLRFYGLQPEHYLIDVGCGSGRLAKPLAEFLRGPYLGTDIVAELVDYARSLAGRADWRFEVVDRIAIPEANDRADMVCFFSVFTHVLHEQTYMYLEEAKRVLKPGGRVVFSFLEFLEPAHWVVFADTIEDARGPRIHPLNVFIDRHAIHIWAHHLGLRVDDIRSGAERFVPLPEAVTLEDGTVLEGFGNLGQSIAVLSKPG